MALSSKFNGEALDALNAEQTFNPFAANVHLTGPNAAKLAVLEDGAGIGIINRVTTGENGRGTYGDRRDRRSREEDARARMLALAQQWDAQIVTVGGVAITNAQAQAQAARRRILENPEYYADWAKQRGLISDGEERQFIDTARRITDLKDRERTGQLTPEQRDEMERLQGSRLGRAVDEATGQAHRDRAHGLAPSMEAKTPAGENVAQTDALFARMDTSQQHPTPPGAPADDPLFASAPSLNSAFAAGLKATERLSARARKRQRMKRRAAPIAPPRRGLDL